GHIPLPASWRAPCPSVRSDSRFPFLPPKHCAALFLASSALPPWLLTPACLLFLSSGMLLHLVGKIIRHASCCHKLLPVCLSHRFTSSYVIRTSGTFCPA